MADEKTKFAEQAYQFGADLYKELSDDPSKNVIYSPLSIQTCLSMVYLAAGGKTFEEMGTVLKYGPKGDKQKIASIFKDIMDSTDKESGLKIANRIYVMHKYQLKKSYNELASKHFGSEVEHLDFSKNVESAGKINAWVEDKTNSKIKDLIKADQLDSDTRAVLVNAIYFKGKWLHPFDPANTRPMPFYVTPEKEVQVDMMFVKKRFNYGVFEKYDATALEMQYEDSNISMIVILPNKKDGLKALEEKIHDISLKELDQGMHNQEVEVFLPKFEYEFEKELTDVLKKLGMPSAFSGNADFSGLLDSPEPLQISTVIHKAFIKVDEEGAEAAAATAVGIMLCCMPPPSPKFNADHPFMFLLRTRAENQILFCGNIMKF